MAEIVPTGTANLDFINTTDGMNIYPMTTGGSTLTLFPQSPVNDKMKIFKKLNDVMAEIRWVGKDGEVKVGGGYKYASEAAFISEVRPMFVQYGLVIYPTQIKEPTVQVVDKKDGGKSFLTTMVVKYIIGDTDSGEFIEVEVMSQGADSGDKGVYKAMTGAFKYALRQTLMIGTGDDPEATDEEGYDTSRSAPSRSTPTGGDYPPKETVKPTKATGSEHYAEQVKKVLADVDLSDAATVFKKRKINLKNLPTDTTTLRVLYDFAREIKSGKPVAEAAADLDAKLG